MKEIEENKKIKIILIAIISILVILLGIEAFFILKDTKTIKNAKQGLDVNKTIQTSTNPENDVKEEQPTEKKTIVVHITGEVNKPGVIELEEGKRIIDAIKTAGGATSKANLTQINLAYVLKDGMKIYIPNIEDKNIEYITTNIGDSDDKEKININLANEKDLQKLPGIGTSTAKKIIKYREENGEFKNIEDIKNVKGIGESKYEEIKEKIEI
jgi:competence protein ComEA